MTQSALGFPSPIAKSTPPFVNRVAIKNYRSIGSCDVSLERMSILVGRNGAGKSNFLDALRFVVDGLETSLDHAMKTRSGIESVRRKSTGHPRNFAIQLHFSLPDWRTGRYGFEIAARPDGGFSVKQEEFCLLTPEGQREAFFTVRDGEATACSAPVAPRPARDRLYLVSISGLEEFRPAYDALTGMGFYNLNPDAMKALQSPDAGEMLHRDGSNIASVVARLAAEVPSEKGRTEKYLGKIVPGISSVERIALGPSETIEFRQSVVGARHPWRFYAANMSDGTLRSLAILVAVSQLSHVRSQVRLVGIEEPETALHPAAARALTSALKEAAEHTQILLTTHSADLLDDDELDPSGLLAVESKDGETFMARLDTASQTAIRDHLYSPGELLRMDQLEPDASDRQRQRQATLFDIPGEAE